MKALITGVTGLAGSHLAEHLLACGDEVLGVSRRGVWPAGSSELLCRQVELFRWDLSAGITSPAIDRVASFSPDAVYHLAAISIPADCGDQRPTAEAVAANVVGTRTVLELARSLPKRPRVLFTSSCYVYAPVHFDHPVVTEDAPLDPQRGYGMTKLAAEQQFLRAVNQDGLDGVIARPFQHAGPRQSERMILSDWAKQFTHARDESIRAVCLDAYFDLTDVRDVVRAYRALVVDGQRGSVYNVGSGVCRRSGDLLEQMRQIADPRRRVVELSPGRRQHPIAEISRLTAQTAWRPAIPLHETLADILDFWQQRASKT